MPPIVIHPGSADEARDAVHHAVQALAEGQLVVFPTETVYGVAASAARPEAVEGLLAAKQRPSGQVCTLAIDHPDAVLDYAPGLSVVAQRLARRGWPGPLTLVLDTSHPHSLVHQLPEPVQRAVRHQRTCGFRVPDHSHVLEALRLMEAPLVLSSANISGQPDALTAEQAAQALGDRVALVLDGGRSKYALPSSVVRVDTNRVTLLRAGVLTEAAIQRAAGLMVLLVCTGNTCRSPMAQVLLEHQLAQHLNCPLDELEQHGVLVMSAGLAAGTGMPASPEAVDVMRRRGLNLAHHESRPVSEVLVRFADQILTMTAAHRSSLVAQWPEAATKNHLLDPSGGDISDPIGGTVEAYGRCAEQIAAHLPSWLEQLDLASLPVVEPPTTGRACGS